MDKPSPLDQFKLNYERIHSKNDKHYKSKTRISSFVKQRGNSPKQNISKMASSFISRLRNIRLLSVELFFNNLARQIDNYVLGKKK